MKVINKSYFDLPKYETLGAVGMDIRANIDNQVTLDSLQRAIIPTGLFFEVPEGFEVQVRPRSGMAAKFGISVLNTPGTIDPDYRGELKIILVNLSKDSYVVQPGERIAQIVLVPVSKIVWELVGELSTTDRGEGGFGHTGK